MKNLSLLLNIVLVIAVAILYFKVYSGSESKSPVLSSGNAMPANAIVFINSDSLLNNYDYFNSLKDDLESKQDSIENYLQTQAKSLERDVMNYQEKAPGMSADQRAGAEEKLMMRQQKLMELKENMLGGLQDEEMRMNDSIHANLSSYLREYNKDKNYLYILGYQRGSGILFADDSLDITSEIIKGLNKK